MIVIGANSEVAIACIDEILASGKNFPEVFLFTSSKENSLRLVDHFFAKYEQACTVVEWDFTQSPNYSQIAHIQSDILICASGYLGKQPSESLENPEDISKIMDINYSGAVLLISHFASKMMKNRSGTIIGISSVAGERGRMTNFFYGSAKAGFTTFLDGLRNFLYPHQVHVITVKPGFMATKMTEGLNLPQALTASPKVAAKAIINAWKKKKNTVYILPIWRLIMFIIRNIPEFIFKKMKL